MVNELLPFLGFVEQHPVGSTVPAVVESYSSHGAYVTIADARGYVPLRLMAEPTPRSARSMMKLGDTVDLVVVSFNATRRSIDLCVPGMEPPEVKALAAAPARPAKRSRKKAAPEADARGGAGDSRARACEADAEEGGAGGGARAAPAARRRAGAGTGEADAEEEGRRAGGGRACASVRRRCAGQPGPGQADAEEGCRCGAGAAPAAGAAGAAPVKRTRKKAAAS